MTAPNSQPKTLQGWLSYIEALHPKSIAMGLDRVQEVARRLDLIPKFPIITVAGTNGKGSTCAMLSQIYAVAGYHVGCYTSPHLIRYNERVKVNQVEVDDESLCQAFSAIENARRDVQLTYFEMGTLAAVWLFMRRDLDVAILEVGLGGRLDAVNIFTPNCAIVTNIDLDHIEFLGDTREKIGLEKAGVFRADTPAICGDKLPPASLIEYAVSVGADLSLIGKDFTAEKTDDGWQYQDAEREMILPSPKLQGDFQLENAACAIRAVMLMTEKLPVTVGHIAQALQSVRLTGRFQRVNENPTVILDVAHNPHAAVSLAHNLATHPVDGRTLAVFAMLADKDIENVVRILRPHIDVWYMADIAHVRGAKAQQLAEKLRSFNQDAPIHYFENTQSALSAACFDAAKNDRIVVFGSFYTVADAMQKLQLENR